MPKREKEGQGECNLGSFSILPEVHPPSSRDFRKLELTSLPQQIHKSIHLNRLAIATGVAQVITVGTVL